MGGVRLVFAVAVAAMLALAAGAASAQEEGSLPPDLDEGIAPEERAGEETDAGAGSPPTKEKASGPEAASEAPAEEESGASPRESSSPPTPPLASEGVPVSGDPTSGYATPDGARVPVGAVSSGGLARLPATGGA